MSNKVCKFYAYGDCAYGSSCKFLHVYNRAHSNYEPKYGNKNQGNYKHYDQNEQQNKYHYGYKNSNYYSTNDYNYRNSYERLDQYSENFINSKNYVNYCDNYQSQNQRNLKKYYNSNEDVNMYSNRRNYNYENKLHQLNEKKPEYLNKTYEDNLNKNSNSGEKLINKQSEKMIDKEIEKYSKKYEREIKSFQNQINGLIHNTVWPLTCFHPIGHTYPIQSVGILNLPEVSFEELRCDYYLSKDISANSGEIHKKLYDDLLLKSQQQKKSLLSLSKNVLNDLITTFNKCQQSKSDTTFQNTIEMNQNDYWNMSINHLKSQDENKSQLDAFSFVTNSNETEINNNPPEIFMQHVIYGTEECVEFEQKYFTGFIPILPPPKKYCF